MSVLEKIQELCKERNINPSRLESELGFGKGTLYKWDKSSPSADKLVKVADYFNISSDYLLGRTNIKNPYEPETIAAHHDGDEWTDEELEDIEKFKEFVKMKRSQKNKN